MLDNPIMYGIWGVFALISVFSASMVIMQRNPVRCVLFFVMTCLSTAVLWLVMQAEFLALILILVYVGAVMTLFLFVVMMLNIHVEAQRSRLIWGIPLSVLVLAGMVAFLIMVLPQEGWQAVMGQSDSHIPNVEAIGMVLYTDYLFAFEVAAVLLLVAIVAAIALVFREGVHRSKRQNIRHQIMVKPKDRLTIVSMKSEKSVEAS